MCTKKRDNLKLSLILFIYFIAILMFLKKGIAWGRLIDLFNNFRPFSIWYMFLSKRTIWDYYDHSSVSVFSSHTKRRWEKELWVTTWVLWFLSSSSFQHFAKLTKCSSLSSSVFNPWPSCPALVCLLKLCVVRGEGWLSNTLAQNARRGILHLLQVQIITDTCHYWVSVTLEINSLQSVLMLHPFSY